MAIHTSKFNFLWLATPQSSQRQMATQVFTKLTVASKKSSQVESKTLFAHQTKMPIYVIITSKFASIKFQQCCVRKLKTKSLQLKFNGIARTKAQNQKFALKIQQHCAWQLKFNACKLAKAQIHKFAFKFSGTVRQSSNPFFANSLYQHLALRLLW